MTMRHAVTVLLNPRYVFNNRGSPSTGGRRYLNEGNIMGDIIYADMDGSVCGYYEKATGLIRIDRRLNSRRRSCTYVHEQIHKELGHGPAPSLAVYIRREIVVERLAARRMITLPQLIWATTKFYGSVAIANALGVDQQLYHARLLGLSEDEQLFMEICGRQCIGVRSAMAKASTLPVQTPAMAA